MRDKMIVDWNCYCGMSIVILFQKNVINWIVYTILNQLSSISIHIPTTYWNEWYDIIQAIQKKTISFQRYLLSVKNHHSNKLTFPNSSIQHANRIPLVRYSQIQTIPLNFLFHDFGEFSHILKKMDLV